MTGGWRRDERENRLRTLRYTVRHVDLTFWEPIAGGWSITGTLTTDRLGSMQAYLSPWLFHQRSAMGSLSGPIGKRLSASLFATRTRSTGSAPSRDTWYGVSATRRLNGSTDLEVRLQRENFTDEVTAGNSFRSTLFVVEGRSRF